MLENKFYAKLYTKNMIYFRFIEKIAKVATIYNKVSFLLSSPYISPR